ncbi:sugar efflux transporter [Marinagarivorans cellulosilyticus]|uniref:MFS transporter, SET family, sugar efflux transporter n=1 Tax=Marinagarivorans cellulosilyticus TaxID=2721545 RepID=A0AAN1WIX6_9GAMM|nr:sugar efflux transporter [Marinagarivorans cellulosilyticus]BCD98455.1 MFS transporter, SET family, sugar efflux transporter [Marinagarivorans cellulosilyticus]
MKQYIPLLRPGALLTYFVAFTIGSLWAQIQPTLSVYLVERFESSPFYLGVFFVALAASAIVVSQVVGLMSDKGINRLMLIFLGMVAGAIACVCFALSPSYWLALTAGVVIFSFSAITLPQIMAHGREYADGEFPPEQVPLFNAILRASFALSWIGGPPLGFHLQYVLGSSKHYLLLAIAYVVVGIVAWSFLPKAKANPAPRDPNEKAHIPLNLKLGFVAFSILFGVNHSYMIALPQMLVEHLSIKPHYAGYILGAAAALEIPVMLLGGWLATRTPLLPLLRIGAASAMLLYVGVWFSNSLWQLIAMQALNALFIGFIAGLGTTWFQDQMPKFAGTASSLFVNTINLGNIFGSLIVGVIAAWVGYHNMYLANALVAATAIGFLFACSNTQEATKTAESHTSKAT